LQDPALAARTLANLAFASQVAGDLSGARRLAVRAVARAVEAGDSALVRDAAHTCGGVALAANAPAEAGEWLDRAFAATSDTRPELRADMLVNRGLAWHLQNRLDEATGAYRRALPPALEVGSSDLVSRIYVNLGDVAERRGEYAEAFLLYGEALTRIDSLRQGQSGSGDAVKALASRVYVHEAMIHLLGKLDPAMPDSGYAARAFDWAERSRSRALLDLTAAAGGHERPATTVGVEQARALLRSDHDALLEYSVGDSSTSLWVIRRSGWRLVHLPPRRVLAAQVQIFRRDLGDPASADAEGTLALARTLYKALIEPVEPMLHGVDRLVISTSGALALIPFEALLTRDAQGARAPKGAFLAERYVVRYTPSATALSLERPERSSGGIVAVGNPTFGAASADSSGASMGGGPRLAPLPNTARELASLQALAAGRELTMLSGNDASAERVRALPQLAGAGIVHLATHGDVNEAEPDRSGLWLAPDSAGSGPSRLEVADVLRMKLAADLVTLSACQTGLGKVERGEGVIGLQRAFLAAGARSVLVSLWSVNDQSTATLMDAFYRRTLSHREDRASALTAAKRELLANAATRSPFYWAPFVLVGDPAVSGR
jgi:CHAT domain-containing protein